MKLAKHWDVKDEKNNIIQCGLCPHRCVLSDGKTGICRVRQNQKGKLYSLVYAKPVSSHIDPIEKKPLFHFLPGTDSFSFGTVGCNLRCTHCQNWEISQKGPDEIPSPEVLPQEIIEQAKKAGTPSISYTYTEPTIFYEYVLDTAIIAHDEGIKNVMVTNGYINEKPIKELYKFIDAANIDMKGFNEEFYVKQCGAKLKHVLDSMKAIQKMETWIELTNLIIPTRNDNMKEIKEMCEWIVSELGEEVPLHFSRFFPMYKENKLPPTPEETLFKAKEIAVKAGLRYVYIGNLHTEKEQNTYCPKCKKLIIARSGFGIVSDNIREGKCSYCKTAVSGIWNQ